MAVNIHKQWHGLLLPQVRVALVGLFVEEVVGRVRHKRLITDVC